MSRIQNEDIKSASHLIADGGTAAQLPNDDKVYLTANGLNKTLKEAIENGDISGSAGNYVLNPEYKVDTSGNTAYKDAAGTEPVDGSGGSPTLTITRSTSLPLSGVASGVIGKPPSNVQGEGINIALNDFDIADKSQKVLISFEYDASDPDYVDADFRVFIYDNTNSSLIRVSDEDIKGGKGTHYATFQIPYNCDSASLLIHCATSDTLSYDLKIDRISLGRTPYAVGTVNKDWETFTPTGSWVTNTTYVGSKARKGDTQFVETNISLSGAPNAVSLTLTVPVPIDLDVHPAETAIGFAYIQDSSTSANNTMATAFVSSATTILFRVVGATGISNTAPFTFANGDTIKIKYSYAVDGWESQGVSSIDLGARDIKSVARNSATTAVTSGTAIHFANVSESRGGVMWTSSTQFTPLETNDYLFSGDILASATITTWSITVFNVTDSVQASDGRLGHAESSALVTYAGVVALTKGKVYEIRTSDTFTPSAAGSMVSVIKKMASPQSMLGATLIAACYTTNTGNAIGTSLTDVIFEDLVKDETGIYNPGTGVATIPESRWYRIRAQVSSAALNLSTSERFITTLDIDGTSISGERKNGTGASVTHTSTVEVTRYLTRGTLVKVRAQSSSATTVNTAAGLNEFSIIGL